MEKIKAQQGEPEGSLFRFCKETSYLFNEGTDLICRFYDLIHGCHSFLKVKFTVTCLKSLHQF